MKKVILILCTIIGAFENTLTFLGLYYRVASLTTLFFASIETKIIKIKMFRYIITKVGFKKEKPAIKGTAGNHL